MNELKVLYTQHYRRVRMEMRKFGCTESAFKEIYHEAFFVLYEKNKSGEEQVQFPFPYLFRICKNLWIKEWKRQQSNREFLDSEMFFPPVTESDQDKILLMIKHLKIIPEGCREILGLYALGYSEQKIVTALNPGDPKAVKNKKFYCKKKLKSMIMNDPLFDEIYG